MKDIEKLHLESIEKQLQEDQYFSQKYWFGVVESVKNVGGELPKLASVEALQSLSLGQQQVITAEAFWWGYHFVIPENVMKDLNKAGNVISVFMSLGGSIIAASGGSLAPLVAVVAAYVAAELVLMNTLDQGKGIYLSATWVAPAAIIPTPIT